MSVGNVDVIRGAISRLNDADVDGYLSTFRADCLHWISSVEEAMPMRAFADSLHAMRRGLPDMQLDEVNLFAVDRFVCAQWRTHGTHTAELFGIPPTGRTVSFDTAEVYELDDDSVKTSWAFGDAGELFRQLAPSGQK